MYFRVLSSVFLDVTIYVLLLLFLLFLNTLMCMYITQSINSCLALSSFIMLESLDL